MREIVKAKWLMSVAVWKKVKAIETWAFTKPKIKMLKYVIILNGKWVLEII